MKSPARNFVIVAAGALVVGFLGGWLSGRLASPRPAAPAAQAGWDGFGKLRPAAAPRAVGAVRPDGFAVWTTRIDTARSDPMACARMTRPLDPRRSYGDFVLVSPDLGRRVDAVVRGDELCVVGVGYTGRQVTLLKGLPALGGETLEADVPLDFAAASRPPAVAFDGVGVILPREEADGLGVDTVNVSRLHIEVWRVADRNLARKTLEAPEPSAEGEWSYEGDWKEDARQVWTGEVPVKAAGGEKVVTVFPLGAVIRDMRPGAYVVTAEDASGARSGAARGGAGRQAADGEPSAKARRWILLTDMGLSAYHGADGLDVVVRSLKSAKALAGVRTALVASDGDELAAALTDPSGHVRFDRALFAGEGAAKPAKVMAYGPKADFALLDLNRGALDLSSQVKPGERARTIERSAAGDVDAFLFADRGVYRPGDLVHVLALLRDRNARAIKDRAGALVVRRPSGAVFQTLRFKATPSGEAHLDLAVPKSAPRGRWTVSLEMDGVDGASGEARFDVQDVAPQRLAVSIAAAQDRPVSPGESRRIAVDARFLYGAPGSGLDAELTARLAADPDPFPAYVGYRFGDETTAFDEKLVTLPKAVTDPHGEAAFTLPLTEADGAQPPLRLEMTGSVLEPGGRPVAEAAVLKVRKRPLYLGVKASDAQLGEERTATFDLLAVDPFGRKAAVRKARWTLIAEHWSYDWYEAHGRWGYHRNRKDTVVAEGQIDVTIGGARITRRLPAGDYRLAVEDPVTGARTVVRQSSGWDSGPSDEDPPDLARLAIGPKTYGPGEEIPLRIQAPFGGEAEIAVATDRVLALKTAKIPKGGAVVPVSVTSAWGGGAYVMVTVVEPRDPATSPKPRRAIGILYVPTTPRGRVLQIALGTPEKLDARAPVEVPVDIKGLPGGRAAHIAVAAVDEGVLRLTHYASPDPAKWYFGRRALGVDYRDDYGRLLNPNLAAAAAVRFGGDSEAPASLATSPIRTVALWSGVLATDTRGHAVVRLPPGDYNGQLRIMAVAWTDEAVGGAASDVIVRRPVVADLDLPRFLAPGDTASVGLELDNVEGRAGLYRATIEGGQGLSAAFRGDYNLPHGRRILDHAPLSAPMSRPVSAALDGVAGSLNLRVLGPGFEDAKSYSIMTRRGWSPVTRVFTAQQRAGEVYVPPADLASGLTDAEIHVSFSPFQGFDPAAVADALSLYPFGCSEQVASSATPLLYAAALGLNPRRKDPHAGLTDAVIKLLDRQGLDGAFGLWSVGDGEMDGWVGGYVADFLLEARAQGIIVPDEAIERALRALRAISSPEGGSGSAYRLSLPGKGHEEASARLKSRAAAYALYDLAKGRAGDLRRLRWFHDVQMEAEPSPLARAQIGAGLALMGDRGRAHDSFLTAVRAIGYKDDADVYQSPLRDLAGVIALAVEAGELDVAHQLERRLGSEVKRPGELNTQEQSFLLRAARAMQAEAGPLKIDASGALSAGRNRWSTPRPAAARFANRGTGPVWRTVVVRGSPLTAPGAAQHGLQLQTAYYGLDGRPMDPANLQQGQRILVKLSGRSLQARTLQASIVDLLPAGFEIEALVQPEDADGEIGSGDLKFAGAEGRRARGPYAFLGPLSRASDQTKADDRYQAALTAPGLAPFALAFVARAVAPGDYFRPGAEARDMYHADVFARAAAGRTRVSPAR